MNEILLFGVTREIIGGASLKLTGEGLPENVGDLRQMLMERYPELRTITSLRVAVNNEFASDNTAIQPKDEVALIPPVSGG